MTTSNPTATSSPTATSNLTAPTVDCSECAGSVMLDADLMLHEIVPCMHCGAELEILELDPARVELAPEIEEDWGE